ncbi:MAG: DNA internalization-related competence protein ComEC/Rec2, partial [Eggerthellaceae bacterium]|nr:DNA internalization-related competence protein ComEC/Rec2 [Eggerthellaceae bacterium]
HCFEVTEDLREGSLGKACTAKTTLADGQAIQVRLVFKDGAPDVGFGDIIDARCALKANGEHVAEFFWQQGVDATADVHSFEKMPRHDLFGQVIAVRNRALAVLGEYDGQGAALLCAILLGQRAGIDAQGVYGDIKVVGLAHLVAVSGSHLVIVAAFLASVLRLLHTRRAVALAVQAVFVAAYLVLTGMQISAIRAGFMSVVVLMSFFARRRASSMNALSVCIILVVASSPESAVSVSFLMSAASTLGIIVLGGLCDNWLRALPLRLPAFVRDALTLTLASSLVLIPLTAAIFSQVSLVSPVSNIIAAPVFALLCTGGLVALCLVCLFAPLTALLVPLLAVSQSFCELVSLMAKLPFAAIPANAPVVPAILISLATLSLLWYTWPKPSKGKLLVLLVGAATAFACMAFVIPLSAGDEIIMLDVGQGDAFVVRSGRSCMLIDTGNHDSDLLSGLARHGIYALDTVVITHPDNDHCGSLAALQGVVQVRSVCVAKPMLDCGSDSCESLLATATGLVGAGNVKALDVGDAIMVGDFKLTAVWPYAFTDEGGNADSLCLLLERERGPGWKALFTGDLEARQVDAILEAGLVGDIDILKVGHHGARVSLDAESITGLSPEVALISVGAGNRYGHPSPEAIGLLENAGCEVFRTDELGDVVCKLTDGKIALSTLR